jgi:hypothetical protein
MGLSIATAPFPARVVAEPQAPPLTQVARALIGVSPLAAVTFLNAIARPDLDPTLRLLASVVCFLGCMPFVFHALGRKGSLPFMPVYALLFIGYYGTPVFLDEKFTLPLSDVSISDPVIIEAEAVVLLGLVMLLIGYYGPGELFLKRVPRLRHGFDEASGIQVGWIMVSIGLVFVQLRGYIPVRVQAFGQIAQQLGGLGLALLFYYYLKGRLRGIQVVVMMILIPALAIVDISGGGVSPIMQHFMPLMGTYWIARRKILWKTTLVVALIMIPVSGVKGKFRAVAWSTDVRLDATERTAIFYDLIKNGFQTDDDFYYNSFQATMERMNQLSTLAAVQVLTPSVVPYWGGATYADFYWSLIPRFLYPEKPGKVLGQTFGHRYGLLGKFDIYTSFNFPQLVEFYANFGFWGVAGGMLLIGFFQRLLYHMLTAPDAHPSIMLLATILLSRLFSIDSDFSLVYGGMILNFSAMVFVLAILRARRIHMPMDIFRFRW